MRKRYQKPEGVRDVYGEEYEQLDYLIRQTDRLFRACGYQYMQTPSFEFITVFDKDKGTAHTSDLFKMVDKEGHTLVLRPDFTPAVARAAAMYFQEDTLPLRLCYKGSVYLNSSNFRGRLKESLQMGVELINDPTAGADAEIIALVAEIMKACGIRDFRISIGNAAYFRALVNAAELDDETAYELRSMLTQRNQFGAQEIIEELTLPAELKTAFTELPMLFGGREVLDRAEALTDIPEAREAVRRMADIYNLCSKYGCEDYISFDFGMLSDYTYYTGIIFNALTYGSGDAVIKGGRYDRFLEKFGKSGPAIGFTVSMDAILNVFRRNNPAREDSTERIMIAYRLPADNEESRQLAARAEDSAIRLAKALRTQGKTAAVSPVSSDEEAHRYGEHCRKLNFGRLVYIGSSEEAAVTDLQTEESVSVPLNRLEEFFGEGGKA